MSVDKTFIAFVPEELPVLARLSASPVPREVPADAVLRLDLHDGQGNMFEPLQILLERSQVKDAVEIFQRVLRVLE